MAVQSVPGLHGSSQAPYGSFSGKVEAVAVIGGLVLGSLSIIAAVAATLTATPSVSGDLSSTPSVEGDLTIDRDL